MGNDKNASTYYHLHKTLEEAAMILAELECQDRDASEVHELRETVLHAEEMALALVDTHGGDLAMDGSDSLMMAARNSGLPRCILLGDVPELLSWHVGELDRDWSEPDLKMIGAEVGELYPMIAHSLNHYTMMLAEGDDEDGIALEGCAIISALLRRLAPEVDLLSYFPDAIGTGR